MLTKKAKLFFDFWLGSANSIYLRSQIEVNGWFPKKAWNPEQTSNTIFGDFSMPLYFDCASVLSYNRWSIFQASLWHVEIHLTCLDFSLCQDNNSYSLASASSRPLGFDPWALSGGWESACFFKIIDFSTGCGACSDECKLREVTLCLPQRCCVIQGSTVPQWCRDVPQAWMRESERKLRVKALPGKQTSVISFPEPQQNNRCTEDKATPKPPQPECLWEAIVLGW